MSPAPINTTTAFLCLVKSAILSKSITSEPGILLTKSSLEISPLASRAEA